MIRRGTLVLSAAAGTSASKTTLHEKHVKRHWINEAACYWYAFKEGRLGKFRAEEAARKERGTVAEKKLQPNGSATPQMCMIWGENSQKFEQATNTLSFINAGVGVGLLAAGVGVFVWVGYQRSKMSV